jgi:hypothetical protein
MLNYVISACRGLPQRIKRGIRIFEWALRIGWRPKF